MVQRRKVLWHAKKIKSVCALCIPSKLKIIGDGRNRNTKNNVLIALYFSAFCIKKHRIRIVSSQKIIDGKRPITVSEFSQLVTRLQVYPQIHSHIVGNPVGISIRIMD